MLSHILKSLFTPKKGARRAKTPPAEDVAVLFLIVVMLCWLG